MGSKVGQLYKDAARRLLQYGTASSPLSHSNLLVLSIGNPGPEYSKTRHNAGNIVAESAFGLIQSDIYRVSRPSGTITLFKKFPGLVWYNSQEYMNNSGRAATDMLRWYRQTMENQQNYGRSLLILHDDSSFPVGKIQFRDVISGSKGSMSSSHNGIKSIRSFIPNTQGKDQPQLLPRLRIGIDHPNNLGRKNISFVDYVLEDFNRSDLSILTGPVATETSFYLKEYLPYLPSRELLVETGKGSSFLKSVYY